MIEFDPLLRDSMHFGLPLTTWLVVAWLGLASVTTHNKDLWRAARDGHLPEGDRTPPDWMSFLVLPQYGALVTIALIDGSLTRMAAVWGATFIIAVVARGILFAVGAILLMPYAYLSRGKRTQIQQDSPPAFSDADYDADYGEAYWKDNPDEMAALWKRFLQCEDQAQRLVLLRTTNYAQKCALYSRWRELGDLIDDLES